jgi:hypothetical protein
MGLWNWLFGNRRRRDRDDARGRALAAAGRGPLAREYAHLAKGDSVRALTREAWLSCSDPLAMLRFLHGRASGRKFRLFAAACARDEFAHGTIPEGECPPESLPQYHAAIEAAEALADGGPAPRGYFFHWVALPAYDGNTDEDVAHSALGFDADVGMWMAPKEATVPAMIRRYRTHPAHYLRDIFGSVFHRGALGPALRAWQGGVVVRLAQAAYEERVLPAGTLDLAQLAVLADALEDAGCTHAEVLDHLRGPGPHVRGCWAVDRLLGKE